MLKQYCWWMARYFNSKLLTYILSAAKTELQSYCDTSFSMGGMEIRSGLIKIEGYVRVRTFIQCSAPRAIALSIWLLYPLHNYSPSQMEIKRNSSPVFHKTYKHIVLGRYIYQKVHWYWYHQNDRVFDWQHIWYVWCTCFTTDSPHSYQ